MMLRWCNSSDIEDLMQLQADVVGALPDPAIFEPAAREVMVGFLEKEDAMLGVYECGQLVGCALLKDNYAGLSSLAVVGLVMAHPHRRGRGIQRLVCGALGHHAKERGVQIAIATVSPLNGPSIKNFKNLGYEIMGNIRIFEGKERLLLAMELTNG